jgi:hypothetical protein
MTNSQYLKWFHGIEKVLWSFFGLFDDLCDRCATMTIQRVESGDRSDHDAWCCCMIDNQVHDNWDTLNTLQARLDPNWYEPLKREKRPRMPGNGPCPALGPCGCRLKKYRPITCTTQLCSKMLAVLKELGLIDAPTRSALQIEDLVTLPDILPSLYGVGRQSKVTHDQVQAYVNTVKEFRSQFETIPGNRRKAAITRAL